MRLSLGLFTDILILIPSSRNAFPSPLKFGGENWKARVVEEVKSVAEINSTVS